jgi:hypothetical protein
MSAQEESAMHAGLSELEIRILDFEASWWRYAGAKEAAIKELFELSAVCLTGYGGFRLRSIEDNRSTMPLAV